MLEQNRWYYNAALNIVFHHYTKDYLLDMVTGYDSYAVFVDENARQIHDNLPENKKTYAKISKLLRNIYKSLSEERLEYYRAKAIEKKEEAKRKNLCNVELKRGPRKGEQCNKPVRKGYEWCPNHCKGKVQPKPEVKNKKKEKKKVELWEPRIYYSKRFYWSIIRDEIIKKYNYSITVEKQEDGSVLFVKDFEFDKDRNEFPQIDQWEELHSRVPRGAVKEFVANLNSCLSNYRLGHIDDFNIRYKREKSDSYSMLFEDHSFPGFIKHIDGRYGYTTQAKRRVHITLQGILKQAPKKGMNIHYDKLTDVFTLNYPVPIDWFPSDDKRCDNQVSHVNTGRVIALDPGVRKFQLGYDPSGKVVYIGQRAREKLITAALHIDELDSYISRCTNPDLILYLRDEKRLMWRKIKNLVDDLHWKTIKYLTDNYDIILLPEFPVSRMVRGHKLDRKVKRAMLIFSFYRFKQRLLWRCQTLQKHCIIVDESFTSMTCTNCGNRDPNLKGSETYNCLNCGMCIDRDINGARNIFIKNLKVGQDAVVQANTLV